MKNKQSLHSGGQTLKSQFNCLCCLLPFPHQPGLAQQMSSWLCTDFSNTPAHAVVCSMFTAGALFGVFVILLCTCLSHDRRKKLVKYLALCHSNAIQLPASCELAFTSPCGNVISPLNHTMTQNF